MSSDTPGFVELPPSLVAALHVVLVEPGDSLNVGMVARAMSNLGFRNLVLVAPPRLDLERAARTACGGISVLNASTVIPSLADALKSMERVIGFTAQVGKHRPQHFYLHEWAETFTAQPIARTALLFGPEDTGLRQEHLAFCRMLVRIPSSSENSSFNLAQAVLLSLYEIARRPRESIKSTRGLANGELFFRLEEIVDDLLRSSGFYRDGTPEPIPDLVKNLLRRIEPDEREMGVLLALFNRVRNWGRRGDP